MALPFPGRSVVNSPPSCAADEGSVPGSGRFPGEGNGYPLQYSCLENPKDKRPWRATVHGATESGTRLSMCTFTEDVPTPRTCECVILHSKGGGLIVQTDLRLVIH